MDPLQSTSTPHSLSSTIYTSPADLISPERLERLQQAFAIAWGLTGAEFGDRFTDLSFALATDPDELPWATMVLADWCEHELIRRQVGDLPPRTAVLGPHFTLEPWF